MTQFVERSDRAGLINLDYVATLQRHGDEYECYTADGECLGRVPGDMVCEGAIIPNLNPAIVVVECWEGANGEIYLEDVPVVGWAVSPSPFSAAAPLTPDGGFADRDRPWLLRYPDGTFQKPGDWGTPKGGPQSEAVELVIAWARTEFARMREAAQKAADAYAAK